MKIADLFLKECIEMDLQARNKWQAIHELSSFLFSAGKINSIEAFEQAVEQREQQASTWVGFGIGIPHGKSSAVLEPSIAFGRSNAGVEFDSIDDQPVNLVFLLAIPDTVSNNEYLRALSELARMLVHEDIRQQLLAAKTQDDVFMVLRDYKRSEVTG